MGLGTFNLFWWILYISVWVPGILHLHTVTRTTLLHEGVPCGSLGFYTSTLWLGLHSLWRKTKFTHSFFIFEFFIAQKSSVHHVFCDRVFDILWRTLSLYPITTEHGIHTFVFYFWVLHRAEEFSTSRSGEGRVNGWDFTEWFRRHLHRMKLFQNGWDFT